MKKLNKILVIMCVVFIISFSSVVVATVRPPTDPKGNEDEKIDNLTNYADDIFATVISIVQVVSVACVVFAGLRYMYASADAKADIKKGLMYLAIGAIFIFCASTVIKLIFHVGSSFIT